MRGKSIYFMNLEATKWQYVSNVLQNLSINFSCKISLARCSRAYHPSDFTAEYTFALSFFLSVERSVFYIERCIFGTGAPTANTSVEVAAACFIVRSAFSSAQGLRARAGVSRTASCFRIECVLIVQLMRMRMGLD